MKKYKLKQRISELERELKTTDNNYEKLEGVLNEIPECPIII